MVVIDVAQYTPACAMMSLRRWRTLWYVILICLRGGRLCRWRYVATNAVILSQYCRILAGHCAITHVLLIPIAIGWQPSWIVGHATAKHLTNEMNDRLVNESNEEGYAAARYYLQGMHHGACKVLRIALAGKIETVNIFGVAPLMKCGCGLIIFESLQYGAIDNDLMILQLTSNDTECVVLLMMIDLHLAEAR